jgi:all-trans-retinol 13,14-reductase
MTQTTAMWDTIVIGSGIAGLVAAAALAKSGQRVLGLEQHRVPGGMTQTFARERWTFSTGVHYLGGVGPQPGPEGQFGRLLAWLSDGELRFADCGNPYDIVRLPGGFEFGIEHPEARFRAALEARFPAQHAAIARWFEQMTQARSAAAAMLAARGMPGWMAWGMRWWRDDAIARWSQRTLADLLAEVPDAQLRAVLGSRWGDYGGPPPFTPALEHALVTGAYNAGSYFPVGGPARFAQTLMPPVVRAGGRWELGASIERIDSEGGRVVGVSFRHEGALRSERAQHVVSTMGVLNTADALHDARAADWQAAVRAFKPGLSYLALYLGFEGDIAAAGASAANLWIYESEDIARLWRDPAYEDAPALYVSFPSLKDPQAGAPTAEVIALCDAAPFARWMQDDASARSEDYRAFKAWVEERLLAQFLRHFPRLKPMLRFHEMSTPLTQRSFVRAPEGAMYGIEMSAERVASTALDVRTPLPGLLLAGQDVFGAGVPAAAMSGLLAAAAIEPRLLAKLRL